MLDTFSFIITCFIPIGTLAFVTHPTTKTTTALVRRCNVHDIPQRFTFPTTTARAIPSYSYPDSPLTIMHASEATMKDTQKKDHLPKKGEKRNMSSLRKWGEEFGVYFADGIDIISSNENDDDNNDDVNGDDCGVQITQPTSSGTTILRVPKSIVFSSQRFLQDLTTTEKKNDDSDDDDPNNYHKKTMTLLNRALSKLSSYSQFEEYTPEFLLVLQLLMELYKGRSSTWYTWIQSLPRSFDTGVYMDDVEISVLPPVAEALAKFEKEKLSVFVEAVRSMQELEQREKDIDSAALSETDGTNQQQAAFLAAFGNLNSNNNGGNHINVFDEEIIKWAFSIVFTRSWRYNAKGSNAAANVVPLGDMFNHKEPGNIFVKDEIDDADERDSDSSNYFVEMILKDDVNNTDNLYLSYGLTNPHRLLVVFGFVDESIPEIFSQVIFTHPTPDLITLGCNDRSKMVYRTSDGAIANAVWDAMLYTVLVSKPDEQEKLVQAQKDGDSAKKADIHSKYALEVSLLLKDHVEKTLVNVKDPFETLRTMIDDSEDNMEIREAKKRSLIEQHPRLILIQKHNAFLRNVFLKVKNRLNSMIMAELEKRKKEL